MESSSESEHKSPQFAANPALHEAIRNRAEEIYESSGRAPGKDVENWVQAEREVLEADAKRRRKAVVVRVNGVQYVGEYSAENSDGYVAGEFLSGSPLSVRFDGDKMFLQRRNGRELETTIKRKLE